MESKNDWEKVGIFFCIAPFKIVNFTLRKPQAMLFTRISCAFANSAMSRDFWGEISLPVFVHLNKLR